MLRGPQTLGELRSRSSRLHDFDGLEAVHATLRGLAGGDDPLVVELSRSPGQKEARWIHLLDDDGTPADSIQSGAKPAVAAGAPSSQRSSRPRSGLSERVRELERRLGELTERVSRLEEPDGV